MTSTSRIERSWVLVGKTSRSGRWRFKRLRSTRGQATSVQADWAWALAREERRGDVIGFWHTHVCGVGIAPSARDDKTMRAWCVAFGKPLVCVITAGRESAAYVYADETGKAQRAGLARARERGVYLVRQRLITRREKASR